MLTNFKREYSIYKTLSILSKRRVVLIVEPGNSWVIEKSLPHTEQHQVNLRTCLIRGWIDILHESIPSTDISNNYGLAKKPEFDKTEDIYRLTDSGWNAIHRTHVIALLSIIIALLGIITTLQIEL